MKKTIDFSEETINMVEMIQKKEGQKTFTSVVYLCISDYFHRKYYNKYSKVGKGAEKKKISLTPEQLCEQVGGQIDQVKRLCHFPPAITGMALTLGVPLGSPDDILNRLNEIRENQGMDLIEIGD